MNIKRHPEPGDRIAYTEDEIPGAMKNGTLIEKCLSDPGDGHANGSRGRILGSLGRYPVAYGYFIEWLDQPGLPVFVKYTRVRKVEMP